MQLHYKWYVWILRDMPGVAWIFYSLYDVMDAITKIFLQS